MVNKNTKRFFIYFICSLLAFSSLSPAFDARVFAEEESEGVNEENDDEKPEQNFDEVLEEPLKKGDEGEQVEILKQIVLLAGFYDESESETFDTELKESLKKFQSFRELETQDGKYDEETHKALYLYLTEEKGFKYKIGDDSSSISDLKHTLTVLGYNNFPAEPTSYYGKLTKEAVKEFQADYNLAETGAVDHETYDLMIVAEDELNEKESEKNSESEDKEFEIEAFSFTEENEKTGVVTSSGNLNVREGPGTDYDVIGSLASGEEMVILGEDEGWYRISYDGNSSPAFVSGDFVDIIENIEPLSLPYEDGDEGDEIVTLKEDLTRLGFGNFPSSPSNRYGEVTMAVVEDFQVYFGLSVTGITDQEVVDRLSAELDTIYRDGQEHADIVTLKEDLTRLEYGNFPSNPSDRYGEVTMGVVSEFQEAEGLVISGIADSITLERLEERIREYYNEDLSLPLEDGDAGYLIVELKEDLTKLGFGNFPTNPSNRYGSVTMGVVEDFQTYFGLNVTGITDQETADQLAVELDTIYRDGQEHADIVTLKEDLTLLGYGNFPSSPSRNYGSVTMGVVSEFQKAEGLKVSGIADSVTLERLAERVLEYHNENLSIPYEDGDIGDLITELKEDLTKLGFGNFPSNPSNRYGPVTMGVVEDFQAYFGLSVTGITDQETADRLAEELDTIYRDGQEHSDIIDFKKDLSLLGYGNFPNSPSDRYGPVTMEVVSEFQDAEGLIVSGIADSKTLEKLAVRVLEHHNEHLSLPYEDGDIGDLIIELKKDLTKLGFGNFPSSPSNVYGSVTAGVVEDFQEYYTLPQTGKVDQDMLNYMEGLFSSPYSNGQRHEGIREMKLNLTQLGFGSFPSDPSIAYGEVTERVVREFQQHHRLAVNGIADSVTLAKISSELEKQIETEYDKPYDMTVAEMVDRQMRLGPQTDLYGGGWQNANREDVEYYVDPANFTLAPSHRDMYQFLVLSEPSGVSASQLNNILNGSGILHNTGSTFFEAAQTHGVNDIYLLAHALLETGHGTSDLSDGSIRVGEIHANKWVSVQPTSSGDRIYTLERVFNESNNRWSWIRNEDRNFDLRSVDLKRTYNMFGVDAVDSDPYTRGSVNAFREGWFTPEEAILGGARFVSENYLARGQNTLYKMRWDPDFHVAAETGTSIGRSHYQYATDIGWAWKQTHRIKELYDQLSNVDPKFEVPFYER